MKGLSQRGVPVLSRVLLVSLIPLMSLVTLSCVMAAGVYLVQHVSAQQHLAETDIAYQAAMREQATLRANRRTQEEMRAIKVQLDNVWRGLPTETEFASLALAISELGRTERVRIPGMQYGIEPTKVAGLPVKGSLSFSVTGPYAAVYRFIHRLESSDSYVVIESLDASRSAKTEQGASADVVFHVTVVTFLRPNPPTGRMS